MSESKTWLPRFTADELKHIGLSESGSAFAAAEFNKRLEEFEATCSIERSVKHGEEAECLCTPSRAIDKRVTIMEIIETLRVIADRYPQPEAAALQKFATRIEREGIINENE